MPTIAPESSINWTGLNQLIERAEKLVLSFETRLSRKIPEPDWSSGIAFRYKRQGEACGALQVIPTVAVVSMDELREIDAQKEKLIRNTEQFVRGLPANNVLLTGARGTGKSSLIKACLHKFAPVGLRLIEIDKNDLVDLPDLVPLVANRRERFVLYCDDLSFEEGDSGYKALKSMLDGTVSASAPNLLVYATSNRRHLLPEQMKDNLAYTHTQDGEVHPGEAVEEKISLSERFGLWISFYPFSQEEYCAIVEVWLRSLGLGSEQVAQARPQALIWALERGSRSGRVAHQFARDYAGRMGLAS